MRHILFLICSGWMMVVTAGVASGQTTKSSVGAGAVDRSTPAAGYEALIDGIVHQDARQVADSVALPDVALTDAERLAYARSVIVGSRLVWAIEQKFGHNAAVAARFHGRLAAVPRFDPAKMRWDVRPARKIGEIARGSTTDNGKRLNVIMSRANGDGSWRLYRSGESAPMVRGLVDDAPWRNAVLEHVLGELTGGRLTTADAVMRALMPQATSRPTTMNGSTPEDAIAAMDAAIERGDVAAVADRITEARASKAEQRRVAMVVAEEEVTSWKLVKAIRTRFNAEQAERVVRESSLSSNWLKPYRNARWSVDGDVARMAGGSGRPYQPWMRMVREGNVWRIQLPAEDPAEAIRAAKHGEKTRMQEIVERTALRERVLAHIDEYKMPGALIDALNPPQENQQRLTPEQYSRQVEEKIAALKKSQATQPAPTTQEAKEQGISISFARLGAAMGGMNAEEAAKYYYAAGEGGEAYVLARERRAVAGERLGKVAGRELGGGNIVNEFSLLNIADDPYGLIMAWGEGEDREHAHLPAREMGWVPEMREVGGIWKIDVTAETAGNAKREAERADREAKVLERLAQEVKEGKIQTIEALRQKMREAGIRGNSKPSER